MFSASGGDFDGGCETSGYRENQYFLHLTINLEYKVSDALNNLKSFSPEYSFTSFEVLDCGFDEIIEVHSYGEVRV